MQNLTRLTLVPMTSRSDGAGGKRVAVARIRARVALCRDPLGGELYRPTEGTDAAPARVRASLDRYWSVRANSAGSVAR